LQVDLLHVLVHHHLLNSGECTWCIYCKQAYQSLWLMLLTTFADYQCISAYGVQPANALTQVMTLVDCRLLQGYGDLHAYSVAEAAYVVVFMFVSIGVAAYFVGTSVLLVAENEKKTGGRCFRMSVTCVT
jgi:hypothetical protein